MSWLERLNDRQNRRLGRRLRRNALDVGHLAQTHLSQFARQAGGIAGRTVQQLADYSQHEGADLVRESAHRYADRAQRYAAQAGDVAGHLAHYGRHEGSDLVRHRAREYASRANDVAHQVADYGRHEGAVLAQAAAVQAVRAGRALRADPMPVIVGAVGVMLLANLLFGHRR